MDEAQFDDLIERRAGDSAEADDDGGGEDGTALGER